MIYKLTFQWWIFLVAEAPLAAVNWCSRVDSALAQGTIRMSTVLTHDSWQWKSQRSKQIKESKTQPSNQSTKQPNHQASNQPIESVTVLRRKPWGNPIDFGCAMWCHLALAQGFAASPSPETRRTATFAALGMYDWTANRDWWLLKSSWLPTINLVCPGLMVDTIWINLISLILPIINHFKPW